MPTQIQPIKMTGPIASCNGGNVLGHPLVYLHLEENGKTVCPYCSQEFINELYISIN